MKTVAIEAIDLVKSLGEGVGRVLALKGVSLALSGGELTLLMGPSGSGKTTLLSVLGGILSPTSGVVRIRGHTTTGARPEHLAKMRRQNIGFVFQSYHLFPTLRAQENVRLTLDVRGERSLAALDKAQQALATVGLAHKLRSFPRDLSGGEQQRVAIARAIVGKPSVILADEPTAALEPRERSCDHGPAGGYCPGSRACILCRDPRSASGKVRQSHIVHRGRAARGRRGRGRTAR
jgi:putative ABC transport system ATP-binding protein